MVPPPAAPTPAEVRRDRGRSAGASDGGAGRRAPRPPAGLLAFVRIAAHYFAHGAWLEEGQLLRDAGRLAGIPGVLLHGRLDLGSPLDTAWALARAWPKAELVVIGDCGHTGSGTMSPRKRHALDRFASR